MDKSFSTILELAGIEGFRFHDLRHAFASGYMLNGGDLYCHSYIKMTERYAKLGKQNLARTGGTASKTWRMMEAEPRKQAGTA